MQTFKLQQIIKTIITVSKTEKEASPKQPVEITAGAIENGLFKIFPSATCFYVFIYLITHCDRENFLEIAFDRLSALLPEETGVEEIIQALKFLEKNDIIEITPLADAAETAFIKLHFSNFEPFLNKQWSPSCLNNTGTGSINKNQNTYYNKIELRNLIIKRRQPTPEEIYQALLTFVPPDLNLDAGLEEIEEWLQDFEPVLLQELVRRVNKWVEKNNNPPDKAFHYLRGIIDDWYQKEIFDYKRLQRFDRLYRETRELAKTYGLKDWKDINPAHMETFLSWLSGDYSLSAEVVRYAIQEACRRKSGGLPSLKYIEDNFILPWKKAGIKTVEQARAFLGNGGNNGNRTNKRQGKKKLKKHRNNSHSKVTKSKNNTNTSVEDWEELKWTFEEFK
ncbi:MAG TPA: DnaD domain protein [Halanaerobiales bacterium]|nr:DnaD domain protein [Halanaerobiales bacterium]